tara:strand:+ start:5053 stop:6075 length:1023 start_codon:yes stop_codon:yes gene_type:complete
MPIKLIWGDNIERCNQATEAFIDENVSSVWKEINISRFNGEDKEQINQALDEMTSPPLGEGARVILLKKSKIFRENDDQIYEKLKKNFQYIPSKTFLIINSQLRPDSRLKITKFIQGLIKTNDVSEISFMLPSLWDLKGQKILIKEMANKLNCQIEDDAINYLIESIGSNPERINNELNKIKLFHNNKFPGEETIIKKDLLSLSIQEIHSNIFKITDLLIEEDIIACIINIQALINKGEPGLRILAALVSQIRSYTIVKLLDLDGEKDINVISQLSAIANPKRIYIIRKKIYNTKPAYLISLLGQLLLIEESMKKGNPPIEAFKDGLLTIENDANYLRKL